MIKLKYDKNLKNRKISIFYSKIDALLLVLLILMLSTTIGVYKGYYQAKKEYNQFSKIDLKDEELKNKIVRVYNIEGDRIYTLKGNNVSIHKNKKNIIINIDGKEIEAVNASAIIEND